MFRPESATILRTSEQPVPSRISSATRHNLLMGGLALLMGLLAAVGLAEDPPGTSAAPLPAPSENGAERRVALTPSDPGVRQPGVQSVPDGQAPPVVRELLNRLESGSDFLRTMPRYTATFTQQVHKDGRLLDPERIEIKVQHEPFAVFMHWDRDGQQALYVEGAHDNKLLVHPTRGFGRLRQVWELDPESGLAMRGARRPVTEIGMLNLVKLLLGFHREHVLASTCVAENGESGNQKLTRYTLTFDGPHENPYFAKTVLWVCNDRHIPLRIENYSWTDDDRVGPLLESYQYTDLCVENCTSDADFDRDNEAYKF
jgi:hypothetical protein